jgi:hypothetical protein
VTLEVTFQVTGRSMRLALRSTDLSQSPTTTTNKTTLYTVSDPHWMECLECLADASLGMLGAVHRVLQGLQGT